MQACSQHALHETLKCPVMPGFHGNPAERHMSNLFRVFRVAECILLSRLTRAGVAAMVLGATVGASHAQGIAADAAPLTWSAATVRDLRANTGRMALDEAWRLVTENSPDYQAALSARAASATELRQGRAGLLPDVQAGHYRGRITGVQRAHGRPPAIRESVLEYDSENTYVQLRQPVLDFNRYAGYRKGAALAAAGEAEFRLVEMELATSLLEAYARAVGAQEALTLQRGLADSLARQAQGLRALFDKNEASRTDAQEVEARLALARADVLASEQALVVALRELAALTGEEPKGVFTPAEPFVGPLEAMADAATWVERARAQGPRIMFARQEQRVADAAVSQAASRHAPNLEFVAAWTKADSDNLSTLSQRSDTVSVGLSLNIPIFSGGYDTAAHAQARALLRQSTQQTRAAEEEVMAEVTRQYTRAIGGLERVRALEQAADSALQSLRAALRSHELGIVSNLDALRAQDRHYETRRELMAARLEVLQGYGALRLVSGDPATEALWAASRLLSGR